MTPPDLVTFRVLHRGMRMDSARLATAIAEVDESERSPRSHQLRRWYDGFATELRAHHAMEDELFFPALRQRVSVLDHQVGRIDAEHCHIDAALDRTQRAIERLGDPATAWPEASRHAIHCASELHDLLDRHLAFDAEFVLPLFMRHFSANEYEALDEKAGKLVAFGQLPFTIPWAMANAHPDEQESMLDGASLMFRLLWYVTRGRYRRLTDEAFGLNGHGTAR